jgi:hypothetical protein
VSRPKQDRVKVNAYLYKPVLDGLKKIARIKGTTYSELLRIASHEYLLREGQKVLAERRQIQAVNTPAGQAPAPIPEVPAGPDEDDPRERV